MKVINILDKLNLDKVNVDTMEVMATRRDAIKKMNNMGAKIALASIPLALWAAKAAGQSISQNDIDILNYAYTLEQLESSFYTQGYAAYKNSHAADATIIMTIMKHENEHVAFLKSVLGSNAGPMHTFDFTAGGAFMNPFTDYTTFLALAQAFEDTGVRAYKGQATKIDNKDVVLKAALQIHSVEARHASEIRRLRGQKGWVTGDTGAENGDVAKTDAVYAGESNVMQGGVDVTTVTSAPKSSVMEAFDEPLDMQAVLNIAKPFIKS